MGPDSFTAPGEGQRPARPAIHSEVGAEPGFAVVPAIVGNDDGSKKVDTLHLREVETVFLDMGEPLRLVPFVLVRHAGEMTSRQSGHDKDMSEHPPSFKPAAMAAARQE